MKIVMDFKSAELNNTVELHYTNIDSNGAGCALLIGFEVTSERSIQRRVLIERRDYNLMKCFFQGDESVRRALKNGDFSGAWKRYDDLVCGVVGATSGATAGIVEKDPLLRIAEALERIASR